MLTNKVKKKAVVVTAFFIKNTYITQRLLLN